MKNKKRSNPLVSVYITNYNYGNFLYQAIESCLKQTYNNYELIIIDDGSTDNSIEVIKKYENEPKVRVILQKNKGLNKSSNVALRAAKGKYIIRLDADDYFDENALLVMTNAIEQNPRFAMVFSDYYYVDINGSITGQERRRDFSEKNLLLDQPAHGACSLIRREHLIEVGGYSEDFSCQDGYDIWLKLTARYLIKNINLPLFYYRIHAKSLSYDKENLYETRSRILKKYSTINKKPSLKVVAVIPVRGKEIDPHCLSLEDLGNKKLLDWTIDEVLKSKLINALIITTSDKNILDHCRNKYKDKVILHKRSQELSRENVPSKQSISEAIISSNLKYSPDSVMELTIEAPFRPYYYLDKAIDTMKVFDVNSVLAVYPETDQYYNHHGEGLVPLENHSMESNLKLEKDYIYRRAGGMQLKKISSSLKKQRVGHIVLGKKASIKVRDQFELTLARKLILD